MRWLAVLLLASCAGRRGPVVVDETDELLRIADNQWARRGELGLEVVESTLNEAYRERRDSPEVLWRLVRLHVARGMAEGDPRASQYAYAEARALGVGCLELDALFVQDRIERGWGGAVLRLDEDDVPCASWTAFAWARWIADHGPVAAALDLQAVAALIGRARALGDDDPQGVTAWAQAMLRTLRPTWEGGDPARGAELLTQVVQQRPEELYRRLDLIRLWALPRGDLALARQQALAIEASPALTPEDQTAKLLAEAILQELPPPPPED